MTPRSPTPMLAGHCDRYVVTVASPSGRARLDRQPVFETRCILPVTTNRCAPQQGLHIGTWARGPGSLRQTSHVPTADAAALRRRTHAINAPRRSTVTYVDRTLNCVDCGVEFIHSAADQEYYAAEGVRQRPEALHELPRQPARQPATAATTSATSAARAATSAATTARTASTSRSICSSCGNQAQVPFKPRMDRPVYCSDCFRTVSPD